MFVEQINKYSWKHDHSIRCLQKCLNGYSKLLEQLDLNKTQETDSLEGINSCLGFQNIVTFSINNFILLY
jgi:hypothetical protein